MTKPALSSSSYKQRKEDFVSNLRGGSVAEILEITAVAPVAVLLWSVLQARQAFFYPYTSLAFLVDLVLHVGTFLLAITLYASAPLFLNGTLVAATLAFYVVPTPSSQHKLRKPKVATIRAGPSDGGLFANLLPTKPFITTYRGYMMITTALAILAVDFKLFPRRFAKVETWGTSLMDLGVGSFVFSAGLVAARPVLKEKAAGKNTPLARRLLASVRHVVPLLVLGVIRLLSVKGLDYAEHVTEYGVHWNFFFTLAFLPPFAALFQSALKLVPSYAALAMVLGTTYEIVLESTALKAYILTAPRTDLISKNREGLFSFFGYLAIYLAGQHTGMYVLPRSPSPLGASNSSSGAGRAQRVSLLLKMAFWSSVWTGLYFLCTDLRYGARQTVSRRLANLPYMLWVAAFNTAQLSAFYLVEIVFFPALYDGALAGDAKKEAAAIATSRVLRAYNRNGLAVFLLANLLTGLVNLTVPTLNLSQAVSMGILAAYATVLTAVAVGLEVCNISIKF